jgi:hypothetical protein
LKRGLPAGRVYGVELKSETGKLSKTRVVRTKRGSPRILDGQEDVFPRLLATGAFGAIEVARSVDEVLVLLKEWKIPHRTWR